MGLALDMCNEIEIFPSAKPFEIITDSGLPADKTNLVYQSMEEVFRLCGKRVANVGIRQTNRIPAASGLGSSAACVVAGVFAANALLNFPLRETDAVELCTRLDGHPDNVVPCIKGGVTAGAVDGEKVYYVKCCPSDRLTLLAATPSFGLKTELSRKVLPDSYSRADVVYSLQRAVVTFAALTTDQTALLKVMDDKLHTPYRKPLIAGYGVVEDFLKKNGATAVYLSGAGPTVMGVFESDFVEGKFPEQLNADGAAWTLRRFKIRTEGVEIC